MIRFTLTPAARSDLKEISDYIELDNPIAAKRVRARLRAAMVRLGKHPRLGHLREDLADEPLRFQDGLLVHDYL